MKSTPLTISSLLALALSAQAATFYPIAGVTSDRSATDLWPASNLIQGPGVGFDAAEPHDSIGETTSTTAWVTSAPNGPTGDFFDPQVNPPARLVFDLGTTVPLNEISLWGYSDTNANGAMAADLRFSDTTTFTGVPVSISGFVVEIDPRQSFSFPLVNARYVEFVPTDNFFNTTPPGLPGGDRVGLSEVAFEVVPEPAAATLGLLGIMALALRRRR